MILLAPNGIPGSGRRDAFLLGAAGPTATVSPPGGYSFLYLDPALTTPNVILAVRVAGVVHVMFPGTVVRLDPRRLQTVPVWYVGRGATVSRNVGFFRLMAGTDAELAAVIASAGRAVAVAPISTLYAAAVIAGPIGTATTAQIPTVGLKGLRVSVHQLDAATSTQVVGPVAADFAAVILPGVQMAPTLTGVASGAPPSGFEVVGGEPPFGGLSLDAYSSDLTLNATQYQTAFDLAVPMGAEVMTLRVLSVAGTGISNSAVGLIVEGR